MDHKYALIDFDFVELLRFASSVLRLPRPQGERRKSIYGFIFVIADSRIKYYSAGRYNGFFSLNFLM